jgi:hypothetical protein
LTASKNAEDESKDEHCVCRTLCSERKAKGRIDFKVPSYIVIETTSYQSSYRYRAEPVDVYGVMRGTKGG